MDISPRKSLRRPADPVDDWLHKEGYFRKHAPRDPACLFRAVSEQIYSTQHYHVRVRNECVDFMKENRHLFEQSISVPLESYLQQMAYPNEFGGINEIRAMSLLYKREFVIFDGHKSVVEPATDNGYKDTVNLCHTLQKQYESVYKREIIPVAAFCQSIVYQTLYKGVFKMPNIDSTVQKMLHDRTSNFRHEKFFQKGNLSIREELATEFLNKIETGFKESEEEKSIAKGVTPFPYRVAKALDPDIYRNTDFDVWHELRREVRNSGWNRWNGTELQVGGKCLVQVDFKDGEIDETDNSNQPDNAEKDKNGNKPDDSAKVGKREPAFLYGHIQEMSKNEGPVVVFIEELGEKRTLPFAALKPLTPKKTKQNNWNSATYRRNSAYDSNQKWKKTWNSNTRRSKDSVSNSSTAYGAKKVVDRNNNNDQLNRDRKSNVTRKMENWGDDNAGQNKNSTAKNYTMETYNACQGFPIENTIDVMPVTVTLDNVQMNANIPQNTEDKGKNSSQGAKNPGNNEQVDRRSPSAGSVAPESVSQGLQQISINTPDEIFYPPPHGMPPPIFAGNGNMVCTSPEGNSYPLPFPMFTEPPAPGSLLDLTIRAINFSAPTSVDANGGDLPFSDPVTLRFFYNLGLACFRSTHGWAYAQAVTPLAVEPNYIPPNSLMSPNTPIDGVPQAATPSEDDGSRTVTATRQNYSQPRRRGDNSEQRNNGKSNNAHQQQQHQQLTKTYNNRKPDTHEYHGQRNDPPRIGGDSNRPSYANSRKSGPPSRYKKNNDGRNRNALPPPSLFQSEHQPPPPQSYQATNVAVPEPPSFQVPKNDNPQQGSSPMQQSPPSSSPTNINNPPQFQPAYGPQTIYTAYYPNEGEPYFAPAPGFFPVPYVAHPEMSEGSNGNAYPPQVYQASAEAYGQPMPAVYPPYMYPPQPIYPGVPQPIGQENWYAVPGHPQFMQYPPTASPQQGQQNSNASPSS